MHLQCQHLIVALNAWADIKKHKRKVNMKGTRKTKPEKKVKNSHNKHK